ncbi:MAG TPA: energy transducer TonB [Vicinamibacterales bacterium]|nr:energy transducer TonB [Vicinamibacterales bacterium]
MPRDLFGDVTRPSVSIGTRKWYTVPLSLISHSAIVLAIVAIPMLAPAMLPSVFADGDVEYIITTIPPPPPPPERRITEMKPVVNPNVAPIAAPEGITKELPRVETPDTDLRGYVPGDIDSSSAVLAPPPEVKAPPPQQEPLRVGGGIRAPVRTRDVNPVYPAIAQAARVQGFVIIEATIGEDGRVTNARVLRSIPLLDQAALQAVRQWEYTPTLLNGVPVPVIMTVTVTFNLR